jgi:hypothetical protein
MTNRRMMRFPRTATAGASATVSVAIHALLIGAAVVATAAPQFVDIREIPEVLVRFLAPPDRTGGQEAQMEQLKFEKDGAPDAVVRGAKLIDPHQVEPVPDQKLSGFNMQNAEAAPAVAGIDSVFTLIEVDSAATRYSWSAAPAYPQSMLDAKKDGYVKAQWVVDENGYADTTTLKLLDWTSDEFAKAVRDALPFMRFSPAKVGSTVVKQIVEQEFTFKINTVMAGAPKKPES